MPETSMPGLPMPLQAPILSQTVSRTGSGGGAEGFGVSGNLDAQLQAPCKGISYPSLRGTCGLHTRKGSWGIA